MNAVNLLPAKHRPRQATGSQQGSSFVVLGVLGAIVLAVLVYVLSANSINSARSDIAAAKAETVRANAQADALGAYGNFAKVKADRVKSVQDLATNRMDWERLLREVAHVLPSGVWVTNADASDTPTGDSTTGTSGAGSAPAAPAAPAAGQQPAAATAAAAAPTGPEIKLEGCAPSQDTVAATLVRLRQLQGATDVKLDHSTKPDASSSASSSSSSSGSAGSAGCGDTHGVPNYDFQVTVSLESPKPAKYVSGQVPASLGGGQ